MAGHAATAMMGLAAYLARAVVGVALLAAGATKAAQPGAFIADIWSYQLIPEAAAFWVAAFLPWLEIVTGAGLIAHRQHQGARVLAAAMLLVFLAAIVISWIRGLDIACGCFGGGSDSSAATNYPWLVTRDLLLLACLAFDVGVQRSRKRAALAPQPSAAGGAPP